MKTRKEDKMPCCNIMLRNWSNSSLKKIVPSENKGAKVLCKSVEGKKRIIPQKSHLGGQASSQEPDALDQWWFHYFLPSPEVSGWNVILQTSGCVEPCCTGGTHLDSHLQWVPWRPACPSSWRLTVQPEPRVVGASLGVERGPTVSVSTAKQNWTSCLNNLLSKQPHNSFPEHCFIFWNNEG